MLTISDWAPLIGAGFAAANALFLVWLTVRQAHSVERKAARAAKESERRG
jgi:hypothetical protein